MTQEKQMNSESGSAALRIQEADASRGVHARLSYLSSHSRDPVSYAFTPPPGTPWESAQYDQQECFIADAGVRAGLGIDTNGFALLDAPTALRNPDDADEITALCYAEAIEIALAITGGTHAYVFDHLVRERDPVRAPLNFGRTTRGATPAANGRIHNDYTEVSGRRRLSMILRDSDLIPFVQHFSIINIWRTLRGVVEDTPLALLDARSVASQDLVRGEVRYPHRNGEIYLVRNNPAHRWFYFPQMDRSHALVFKQYDSRTSGVARFTPHTAFDLPAIPADAPLRKSLEMRCLVAHA